MIDKLDVRVPFSTAFTPEFRFVSKEVKYAGLCSTVSRSKHYQGTIDLRPLRIDAILHAYYRFEPKSHKLELLDTGDKTLGEMAELITRVFETQPETLSLMRIDFAADIPGVSVEQLRNRLRVRYKRSAEEHGEMDYASIGGRTVEYFRYGKSPNCVRVYDKPAECRARFPQILKRCNPDAEPPTFEDTFGFSASAVLTRIERQCGGGRIPPELSSFGTLHKAAEFDPFKAVEIIREDFSAPKREEYSVSEMVKLHGINALIQRVGLQQARAELNRDGNGKRYWDMYEHHLQKNAAAQTLDISHVVEAYKASTNRQIKNPISVDLSEGGTHNDGHNEIARQYTRLLPGTGSDWRDQAQRESHA